MATRTFDKVFDYRALRLLVGLIAFALPFVVCLKARMSLPSISAAYHSDARDLFVGLLFVVAAFLWAYNGHSLWQARLSKLAALAALLVATWPTACGGDCTLTPPPACCRPAWVAAVHYGAAAGLFSILAWFCLGPFRKIDEGTTPTVKEQRRRRLYGLCGITMIACMAAIAVSKLALPDDIADTLQITFWGEAMALGAFGVAWIVAGKWLPFLVDDKDKLYLMHRVPKARADAGPGT